MKYKENILTLAIFAIFLLILPSCSVDNSDLVTPPDENAPVKVYAFTPTTGGKNTKLSLYGAHFGTDLKNIRVTINDVDAEVTTSTGNIITAVIKSATGSGLVKVYIGKEPNVTELVYSQTFAYNSQPMVTSYLGGTGTSVVTGRADGSYNEATFRQPRLLRWSQDSTLYIIEEGNSTATTYAAVRSAKNNTVNTILSAYTNSLIERVRAIAFSQNEDTVFVANDSNGKSQMGIGIMTKNGNTYGTLASVWDQSGITWVEVHPITGEVFIGYHTNAWIYQYKNGLFIPKFRLPGATEGSYSDKGNVNTIIFDKAGTTVYIVSRKKNVIYKGTYDMATGTFTDVKLLAGTFSETGGYADGQGTEAKFNEPCQADLDENGNLYLADRSNHCIRKITSDGLVTTFAGIQGVAGLADGTIASARFNYPEGCKFGTDGALYIADYGNSRIRRIDLE